MVFSNFTQRDPVRKLCPYSILGKCFYGPVIYTLNLEVSHLQILLVSYNMEIGKFIRFISFTTARVDY